MRTGKQFPVALLLLLALLAAPSTPCPTACTCFANGLQCLNKGLTEVPGRNEGPYTGITSLMLNNNDITEMKKGDFSAYPDAESINIGRNRVRVVADGSFDGVANLWALNLAENRVSDLSSLNLPVATELDLRRNVPDLRGSAPGPVAPKLKKLTLAECGLWEFPKAVLLNTPELESLDLSANYLESLESSWFEHASDLEILDASRNSIASLRLTGDYLTALRQLDLSHNRLRTLEVGVFEEATPALEVLVLEGNELTLPSSGPLLAHAALTRLALGRCWLASLAPGALQSLPALHTLDLTRNLLTDLQGVFHAAAALEVAVLSGNGLETVGADVFAGAPKLRELHLDGNAALKSFDVSAVKELPLLLLDVSDTPLACGCLADYWTLDGWATATGATLADECDGESVCDASSTPTEEGDGTTMLPCWDGGDSCPKGEKCCPKGNCSKNGKCAGSALAALPVLLLLFLGAMVLQAGHR